MGIETELMEFLEASTEGTSNAVRDREIIAHFYGFRGEGWPTLEETAEAFALSPETKLSRERIRQIINTRFRNSKISKKMPSGHELVRLIRSRTIWRRDDLRDAIVEQGLCESDFSIRGILNLVDQMDLDVTYEIYTPQLREMSRGLAAASDDGWVIEKGVVDVLQRLMRKAFSLPGRCGIAKLSYLNDLNLTPERYEVIFHSIVTHPDAWTCRDAGDLWYLLESRDNTLINDCERLFSVYAACDAATLAQALRRSMNGRTHRLPYPPETMILRYLREGRLFERDRDQLRFLGQTRELNSIESSVVALLKDVAYQDYPTLRQALLRQGFNDPSISKAVHNSPLVHVDDSRGRLHYRHSLVGVLSADVLSGSPAPVTAQAQGDIDDGQERYARYRHRLSQFANQETDADVEATTRKEHRILKAWLFAGKRQERCALCGEMYHVGSLVTAHKKRRADCSNEERLDPNIVMPLCQFGCDYLYERRYVVIENGMVTWGKLLEPAGHETETIAELVGREVDARWQAGRPEYFATVNAGTSAASTEIDLIDEEA